MSSASCGWTAAIALPIMLMALVLSDSASAQQDARRGGFWGDISTGVGRVKLAAPAGTTSDSLFYLGFTAGYTLSPRVLLGLELSGWLYEAGNTEDPAEGEALSQALLIARYYPVAGSHVYVTAGGGSVFYSNNAPGATDSDGWGTSLGIGYDVPAGKSWSVTPAIVWSRADLDERDVDAITLTIGVTWH